MKVEQFYPKTGWTQVNERRRIFSESRENINKAIKRRESPIVVCISNSNTAVLLRSLRLEDNGSYRRSLDAYTPDEIRSGLLSEMLLKLELPVEAIEF